MGHAQALAAVAECAGVFEQRLDGGGVSRDDRLQGTVLTCDFETFAVLFWQFGEPLLYHRIHSPGRISSCPGLVGDVLRPQGGADMTGKPKSVQLKHSEDPYAPMRSRAHWKASDAARVLGDWSRSGLSMAAFARKHGLRQQRLQWWQTRLGEGGAQAVQLVPATLRRAPLIALGSMSTAAAVVVAVGDVRVEVAQPSEADPRWVGALVLALQGERA